MNNEPKLGTKPTGTEGRDAVHIAIVPVQAGVRLIRGIPVKLAIDEMMIPCSPEDAIGVVDPFLSDDDMVVKAGEWFWLCLYPKTITNLRHVWEHPSFKLSTETKADEPISGPNEKEASLNWLRRYVTTHCPQWNDKLDKNLGVNRFLYNVDRDKTIYYCGTNCHSFVDVVDPITLFHHLSIILGKRIDRNYFECFSCSC